jgi:benzoyl-CoA reductase/2-hydroxyglutaryl-CoA dehydratase subunit BcrC/BadD/HgdB
MNKLLKLCGFEDHEIDSESPRIKKAFNRLGLDEEDIKQGKERLLKYYDTDLMGIRKIFRLIMRELINALLVREEGDRKVIYGFMAPGIDILGSAYTSQSKDVFSVYHCWAFHIVVGCIFGKIEPIIEEAERLWLKAGIIAHCANIKTLVGPISLGILPKPDLLVTSGFTCETAPKTIDLLHELFDIPICCVDTCQDRAYDEYPEPPDRIVNLAAKSLRSASDRIREIVGFGITDEMIRDVLDIRGKMSVALKRIRDLVATNDPLLLSPSHENIWMCFNSLTLDEDGVNEAIAVLDLLYDELKDRASRGQGVVEKGAPRVMAILPAGQTDPRLEQLACEVGIAIVALDMRLELPFNSSSNDPFVIFGMASQQHALALPLQGRISLIIEGCKNLKIDGVFDRFHSGCRTTVADALFLEKAIKKELGIPVLVLEWENFDPRSYNHEKFKRRLEVFKSMMKKAA